MDCFPFIVTLSREDILFVVLQHAILVERKERIDITVKSNKFCLQENSDEYGGHDLI